MTACAVIAKMAPDAVNGGNDMYVVMERARRLDQGYLSAVGISMAPVIFGMQPAPTGALVPGVPRKAVLSGWACQTLLATSSDVIELRKRGLKMC